MPRQSDPLASCAITFEDEVLSVGNGLIERRWRLVEGCLQALSLRDRAAGIEWLQPSEGPDAVPPQGPQAGLTASFALQPETEDGVGAPTLRATLTLSGDAGTWRWHLAVQPGVAAITLRLEAPPVLGPAAATDGAENLSGVEVEPAVVARAKDLDRCERLALSCHHATLAQVILQDRTDGHDNLWHQRDWRLSTKERLRLRGVLFAIEDPLTRCGLVLVKQAPLPEVRPVREADDLLAHGRCVELVGHGCGDTGQGYAWTVLAYRGGAVGRRSVLHRWQRAQRRCRPGRDGIALSNTWGDRNRDARIREDFLLTEIAAGARLGMDVVQVDDGWQRGVTANSVEAAKGGVWEGFWAADPHFWDAHPQRLPRGLAPLAAAAKAQGMGLGLWFAPDSARDFANWRKDADAVLKLWREHGVRHIKIDGVKARTKLSEDNLRRFFAAALAESDGEICFDLDVTAEVRPGYFGALSVGPLFVENRYSDWGQWWPTATLRNLWQLSQVIDPLRLRMEWLNPRRNAEKYRDDPLAPGGIPPDWALAAVLVASPLFWCETSGLDPADVAAVAPLMQVWRGLRDRLRDGVVHPIGDCPDGGSWTGFCQVSADGRAGILIVLREAAPEPTQEIALPLAGENWRAEKVAGSGHCSLLGPRAIVALPGRFTYGIWRLES